MLSFRVFAKQMGLVVALLITSGTAQGEANLKWMAKAGEVLKYSMTEIQDVKYTAQGLPHTNKTDMTVDLTWTVKSVSVDGTIEISQVADRVQVKTVMDGRIVTYDSNDKTGANSPQAEAFSKVYEAMIGKSYTLQISSRGEVVDVKVPDSVIAAVAGNPFEAMADSGSFLSVKGVKNMMAQLLPKLPKEPVNAGLTWKNDLTLPLGPISMVLNTTYTVTDAAAVCKLGAKIEASIVQGAESPLSFKITKQSGSGTFLFDTVAGHLIETSINQSSDLLLTTNNVEIPQTIVHTSKFKLIK